VIAALPPSRRDGLGGPPRGCRDNFIRLHANDYSVKHTVIGRRVEAVADLERVRV
jgi:hypothetical protein